MALADVDGVAVQVFAVVLPEPYVRIVRGGDSVRRVVEAPRVRPDVRVHQGVDEDNLAEGEIVRVYACQVIVRDGCGRARQLAVDEDVAVLAVAVAYLRIEGARPDHLQLCVLEEDRSRSPHEVHITLYVAVRDEAALVRLALQEQRVLEAV